MGVDDRAGDGCSSFARRSGKGGLAGTRFLMVITTGTSGDDSKMATGTAADEGDIPIEEDDILDNGSDLLTSTDHMSEDPVSLINVSSIFLNLSMIMLLYSRIQSNSSGILILYCSS
ncbi:unnamed protein product [Onchocerca flexuosa]|uniref:Uncharacterized protein n=1 Tax=Onchocerca flexuosa TaxID=387005 RepID=A0A183H5D3_9BILA|nr:unnamed protein product [Onchocerca flexuosa]